MLRSIAICVLLTTAFAKRRGFGHTRPSFDHIMSKPAYVFADHASAFNDHVHGEVLSDIHHDAPTFSHQVHGEVISDVRPDGFLYHVATSNGISAQAKGDDSGRIHGGFEWVSPEGKHISLSYVADEHGYRPQGDLLPTPPPIPEAILKSLHYNEKHPYKEESEHHLHHQHDQHHLYDQPHQHDQHHEHDHHQQYDQHHLYDQHHQHDQHHLYDQHHLHDRHPHPHQQRHHYHR